MTIGNGRLMGWKAIGMFLGRDARTVRRWEAERGLPVHRVPGGGSATVWAEPAALRDWLSGAGSAECEPEAHPHKRWRLILTAAGAVGLVAAVPLTLRPFSVVAANSAVLSPYGDDGRANAEYSQARFGSARRSVAGLFAATDSFNDLVRRYPKVAAGYEGQAEAALLLREFNSLPEETAYRRAGAAAEVALKLAPDSPGATRALGFVRYHGQGRRQEGLSLLAMAVSLDPTQAQSYHWLGTALLSEARIADAVRSLEAARARDPGSSAIAADAAYARYLAGSKREAIAELSRITRVDPQFSAAWAYLARFYLLEGRDLDYLMAATTDAQLREDQAAIASAEAARAAYGRGGRAALLRSLIGTEEARFRQNANNALRLALLHAVAGDGDSMVRWLKRAESTGEPNVRTSGGFVEFVPYRDKIQAAAGLVTAKN